MAPVKVQAEGAVGTEEVNQTDGRGEEETDDGAPSGTSNAHAEVFDEHNVEDEVQRGTRHDGHHDQTGIAVGLYEVLKGKAQHRRNGTQRHDVHEADCQVEETAVARTDKGHDVGRQQEQHDGEDGAADECREERGGEDAVGLVEVATPHGLGGENGSAGTKQDADGGKQRDERRDDIDGRYGIGTYQVAHHNGIGHRGQALSQ